MQRITPFDPTAKKSGTFPLPLPSGGWLAIINESTVGLLVEFGNGQTRIVPPFFLRVMRVTGRQVECSWTQDYVITGSAAPAGLSITTGECYDPAEWTEGEVMIALPRLVNVGNPTGGGTLATLQNDGNAAGTQVIEMTASGSPSSNVIVDNDGTIHIKVLSSGSYIEVLTVVPGTTLAPATLALTDFSLTAAILDKINSDAGKITSDGAGLLISTNEIAVEPAAVPGASTSYLLVKVAGNANGRASVGIRADGSGDLRLGNNGTGYQAELYTDGTNVVVSPGLSGAAGCAIPTTRNGVATPAAIYTGATTPTGDGVTTPATGAVWVKA